MCGSRERATSNPDSTGIRMSRNTTSGSCLAIASRASSPSAHSGDDHDVGVALEQLMQQPARQRFVVGDERANHAGVSISVRNGSEISTTDASRCVALRTES